MLPLLSEGCDKVWYTVEALRLIDLCFQINNALAGPENHLIDEFCMGIEIRGVEKWKVGIVGSSNSKSFWVDKVENVLCTLVKEMNTIAEEDDNLSMIPENDILPRIRIVVSVVEAGVQGHIPRIDFHSKGIVDKSMC